MFCFLELQNQFSKCSLGLARFFGKVFPLHLDRTALKIPPGKREIFRRPRDENILESNRKISSKSCLTNRPTLILKFRFLDGQKSLNKWRILMKPLLFWSISRMLQSVEVSNVLCHLKCINKTCQRSLDLKRVRRKVSDDQHAHKWFKRSRISLEFAAYLSPFPRLTNLRRSDKGRDLCTKD